MATSERWVDREFDFDFPLSACPGLLERLRAAPRRLVGLVGSLPAEVRTRRVGGKWSIQEHAGHLSDVESLFEGRLDDYRDGLATLRPAEMSGRRTWQAAHDRTEIGVLLARFGARRAAYLRRLEGLGPAELGRTARHPRLDRTMRLADMLLFQAEHDDYHLARIRELIEGYAERDAQGGEGESSRGSRG